LDNIIRGRLEQLVLNYLNQNPIGVAVAEMDCRISRTVVRRPDLSIFLGDGWKNLKPNMVPLPYPPDIAVEVLSASQHAGALARKIRDYFSAGSQEVWILDPENGEVTVRTKSKARIIEGTDLLETPLLPGFSVAVATLLADR